MGSGEQVVAGWILEAHLGSGGYGEVWRARRRHIDLVRALKLVPIVDDTTFESWRHEIGRLEALNHPNVVRFYDADIVTNGPYRDHAWIATELCERSLADHLRTSENHLLTWAEAERLLDAMLAALAAARAAGMVHRDIKPANIVRHRSGTWKLCDFGTARLVPTDGTHPVTRIIGTSPYMSPGAHRGQQNHAADLYGLAVTIHEALTGQRLHPRPEAMTDSEYIKLVLDTAPKVSGTLPRRWQTVVESLIGEHGELDAAALGTWFAETRGNRPPGSPQPEHPRPGGDDAARATAATRLRPLGAGSVVVTGPMAPRQPRRNGRSRLARIATSTRHRIDAKPTSRTLIGAPVVEPGPTSGPPPKVHIPAPDPNAGPPAAKAKAKAPARTDGPAPPAPPPALVRPASSPGPKPLAAAPAKPAAPAPHKPPAGLARLRPAAPAQQRPVVPAPKPAQQAPRQPYGPRSTGRVPAVPALVAPDPTTVTCRRAVAFVVDVVAVALLSTVLYVVVLVSSYQQAPLPPGIDQVDACEVLGTDAFDCVVIGSQVYVAEDSAVVFPQPMVVLVILVVFVLMPGLLGVTPGKLVCGIKVVGHDGRRPGVVRSFVRTALLVVDGFPWVFPLVGWLLVATTRSHRRLGDMVAGTYVIRRR